jgi:hypothetical protein
MKASTQIALALRHVGKADDSQIYCWIGSFAECIGKLAEHLATRYMATRFDLCLARSEEEARAGIRMRERSRGGASSEDIIDLSALTNLMSQGVDQ